jgi:hypothetical protein
VDLEWEGELKFRFHSFSTNEADASRTIDREWEWEAVIIKDLQEVEWEWVEEWVQGKLGLFRSRFRQN